MMKILIVVLMTIIVSALLMMTCTIISKKSIKDREKMSPFECGFDPISSARMPFSIQFFLIAILFLIFDVEIAIMLPMITSLKSSNMMSWTITVTIFINILIMGLYYEWKNNMLEW
uniref:NADH dehydrogenase subunit 3 n=1 Tax=Malcus auriculatus TaxID=696230 RepID=UPI002008EBB8|nr:NADH dehydrogenase subunit 3 [Malcus auriculatus]UPI55344.1 NADH dehydrogenase subunit 3 [Malcus auriculatus]